MSFLQKLSKPFFVLAPMDDVTDTVFRQKVAETAAPDLFFTEFVNVEGLQSSGRERLLHKLWFSPQGKPIIAQIWGKHPENFKKSAAELVEMGFDGVDINMGCPEKTVVKNGLCVALINNRDLASEIIEAVKQGVAGRVPVSVKTRIGFNQIDLSWIEFLLAQNLDMLTVHARTRKEMSEVPAHWEVFEEIVKLRDRIAPKTALVGNGDVESRSQGEELAEKYGLDGVMIGRGIFHDPYVFAKRSPWAQASREQKLDLFSEHVKLFAKTYKRGERRPAVLNKFCKIYVNNFDGAKETREILMQAKSPSELLGLINGLSDEA
jgi:tRNA-dihydrouridine synthase